MTGRVLTVAFDACDAAIVQSLVDGGRMPHVADLLRTGGRAPVLLPDGLFVGVVWPVLTRGVAPDATGRPSWIDVDPSTYELVSPRADRLGGTSVWEALAAAGRPAVTFDVPHETVEPNDLVTQVIEWGAHDHRVGFHTWPPRLGDDLVGQFGLHPLLGTYPRDTDRHFAPDDYLFRDGAIRTGAEDEALARLIEPGISLKAEAATWLLDRHDWQLGVVAFGESHGVGHQLWHVHDRAHPRHDPSVREAVGSPVETTYQALDAALGSLLAHVGPDDTLVLVLTHGMGPHYDAVHLLEELLGRWDRWLTVTHHEGRSLGRRARAGVAHLPPAARRATAPLAGAALRRRGVRPGETVREVEISASARRARRFFRSWNNDVVGGIRLNLEGREGAGVVDPDHADALLAWLDRQLRATIDVDTGRPLVARTYRREERYPAPVDIVLPDLFVEWHRETPIERVWSPTAGVVHRPVTLWRTGDHQQRSMVIARGPGIQPGEHPPISASAVPAGLAGLLGIELPGAVHPPPRWWSPR